MRIAFAVPLILVLGLAGAAVGQPSAPSVDRHIQNASTTEAPQKMTPNLAHATAQSENPEAAAALLIAVRHRENLERIAKLACAAGDTSKCLAPDPAAPPHAP